MLTSKRRWRNVKKARTKPQFDQFRKAFKKWRKRWIDQVAAYGYVGPNATSGTLVIFDKDLKELSRYIAPGYLPYMLYQFRAVKFRKN